MTTKFYGIAAFDRARAHFARAAAEAAEAEIHPAVAKMRANLRQWAAVSGNAERLASARGKFIEPLLDEAFGVDQVRADVANTERGDNQHGSNAGWDSAVAAINAKLGPPQ